MLGQHDDALAAHHRALELRQRLALADPGDARAQDDAAESHLQIAQSLAALGRVREAQVEAVLAVDGWRGLAERDPDNARMRSSLANALVALGRCDAALGKRTSALAHIEEAGRIRKDLSSGNPDFKQADDAITGLDALHAQIRAGNVPPDHIAFIDPWQN
jgi:tetratricopeptide (TPR) repeat protein